MDNNKSCPSCGSPNYSFIPPNGKPGVEVTSKKTGKTYFPFFKCEDCGKSESTDPNPRKGGYRKPTQKVESTPPWALEMIANQKKIMTHLGMNGNTAPKVENEEEMPF